MRVPHPLWRGFWLAAAMAAGLILLGFTDSLGVFRLERRMVAFSGAVLVGAFLASLPARLRRGRKPVMKVNWMRCLRGFLCGAGMALALGLAGDGAILPALLTGSAGAAAFCAAALLVALITLRIAERRRA